VDEVDEVDEVDLVEDDYMDAYSHIPISTSSASDGESTEFE
jgi:hypothetical protein